MLGRKVGWHYGEKMDTDLVIKALQKASRARKLEPDSIFHSDRGSQYTDEKFEKLLETH